MGANRVTMARQQARFFPGFAIVANPDTLSGLRRDHIAEHLLKEMR